MPSWPAEPKYLSHDTRRVDGPAKLTGRARYPSDIQTGGLALWHDPALALACSQNHPD